MITTAVIAFREFLEAFLIVGVFLGISRKLKTKKEFEIILASGIGIASSLLLAYLVFAFGDQAKVVFTETNAELLENYLKIFSGIFIAYVVISLHGLIRKSRNGMIIKAHQKLADKTFDLSLFLTIIFLVLREGFEIALFTASTSLFATFVDNIIGLALGFVSATVLGAMTFLAYIRFSISRVFNITKYMIVLLGASLVQQGITELTEMYFNVHLSSIFPINLDFLPSKETVLGHLLKSFLGLDHDLSLARVLIMGIYIICILALFNRKKILSKLSDNLS